MSYGPQPADSNQEPTHAGAPGVAKFMGRDSQATIALDAHGGRAVVQANRCMTGMWVSAFAGGQSGWLGVDEGGIIDCRHEVLRRT